MGAGRYGSHILGIDAWFQVAGVLRCLVAGSSRAGQAGSAFDLTDTLGGRADWSAEAKDRGQVAEHGGGSGQGHGE